MKDGTGPPHKPSRVLVFVQAPWSPRLPVLPCSKLPPGKLHCLLPDTCGCPVAASP